MPGTAVQHDDWSQAARFLPGGGHTIKKNDVMCRRQTPLEQVLSPSRRSRLLGSGGIPEHSLPPDASARGQGIFLGSGLATVLELSYSRFRCAQLGARDWESAGLDFDFCLGILVFLRSRVERGLSFFFFGNTDCHH